MSIAALGYFWGDDGYGLERAADAVAERLAAASGMATERRRMTGADGLPRILELVATAPLFGGGVLVTVSEPSVLVRTKEGREAVAATLALVAPGNGLVFIDATAAPPRKARDEAATPPLGALVVAAGGEAREFRAPTEGRLAAWIEARAAELGLRLGRGAAQELARRVGGFVREGDVDRRRMGMLAVAELHKLALLRPAEEASVDDVRALVPEAVPSSTWAFLDAVGQRQTARAAELLPGILEALPPPVLVAVLHRRVRELLAVADRLAAGVAPRALVRDLSLNPYRAEILAGQARRWDVEELVAALDGLLDLDARTKGIPPVTEAQRRLSVALWLAERVAPRRNAAPWVTAG